MENQEEFKFMATVPAGLNLRQDLREKIVNYLKKKGNPEIYWDYRDQLSLEQVDKIINGKQDEVYEDIWERNIDYIYDLETEAVNELKEEFPELEEYDNSLIREEFIDYIGVSMDIKGLIRNTRAVRVRVEVFSNYEGFGWTDRNSGELDKHPYIRQVKKLLKGKYTEKSWQQEIANVCSSCCRLIFYFQTDVANLIDLDIDEKKWKKITIPKEAWAGFYDSWNGSGSVLEIELTEDITLPRNHGKTEYDVVKILLDETNKYSVEETYGLCNVPEVVFKLK